MGIKVRCKHCKAGFSAASQHLGKTTKCPGCQKPLKIVAAGSPGHAAVEQVGKKQAVAKQTAIKEASGKTKPEQCKPPGSSKGTLSREQIAKRLLGGLEGSITRTRPTIAYRLAALIVALVMILLPVIYVGLIVLTGYAVYYHAIHHVGIFNSGVRGRAIIIVFLIYMAPMVCGAILVVFMIKPLFARYSTHVRTRSLKRESEPLLFAFVDRICEIVGAAKPKRIDLDCRVNASASFRQGMLSMLGNDLVLTIGLPLVAGLNTRQFAGVLAHEFGHFAQGAGMRLTYIIRSINFWLLRVVYQRDSTDEWLESAAAEYDLRVSWMLYLAMFFVWLSRRVLWVLMMVGNLVGSYLLRQMEFDADRYETRLAGSKTFAETVHRLQTLDIATQGAYSDLREFYRAGQLGDDLPQLIVSKAEQFPAELQKKITAAIQETQTGWLDTHPADRDRIAYADREQTEGIFHVEMPSAVLLNNFPAQSKATTLEFYREQFGNKLDTSRLRPVSEMLAKNKEEQANQEAVGRYFQGQWNISQPFELKPEYLSPPENPKQILAQLKAAREAMLQQIESVKPAYEAIRVSYGELAVVESLRQCLRAGIKIDAKDKKEKRPDEDQLRRRKSKAEKKIVQARQAVEDYQHLASRRLRYALQLMYVPKVAEKLPAAKQWQRSSESILLCARLLGDSMDAMIDCSRLQGAASILFEHLSDKNDDALLIAIEGLGGKLLPITKQLHGSWMHTPYPYKHAERQMTLAGYLVPTVPIKNDLGSVFNAAGEVSEGAFKLYVTLLGDLVCRAEAVETAVGFTRLADVDEDESTR